MENLIYHEFPEEIETIIDPYDDLDISFSEQKALENAIGFNDPALSYGEQRRIEIDYYDRKKKLIKINRNLSKKELDFKRRGTPIALSDRTYSKNIYERKMNYLFNLRKMVGKRSNPSMPRLSLAQFRKSPHILEYYIEIEKWKKAGNESKIRWFPSIYIK